MTPLKLYGLLLTRYGRQGWWPLTPKGAARPVYVPGRPFPKAERDRFEIAVGAILTQNTAWTNVEKALAELHRARLMEPAKLAHVPLARLAKLIKSSGYFTQKSLKLQGFARHVERRGGMAPLLGQELTKAREELLSLWGIGRETADSILLYAGGRPIFVVDAYTLRIGGRIGWFKKTPAYDEARAFFEKSLPKSPAVFAEFHALLVQLAKYYCLTQPLCPACLARPKCAAGLRSRPA